MDRPTAQDALTEDKLDRLLAQVSPRYPSGKRNIALLLTMADAALRVGEAVALTTKDLVTEGGQLTHVLIRRGKGRNGGKQAKQPPTLRAGATTESRWVCGAGKQGSPFGPRVPWLGDQASGRKG